MPKINSSRWFVKRKMIDFIRYLSQQITTSFHRFNGLQLNRRHFFFCFFSSHDILLLYEINISSNVIPRLFERHEEMNAVRALLPAILIEGVRDCNLADL